MKKNVTKAESAAATRKGCQRTKRSAGSRAARGYAATWRNIAMRLAADAQAVLDNAHWEVRHGSGDLRESIHVAKQQFASDVSRHID